MSGGVAGKALVGSSHRRLEPIAEGTAIRLREVVQEGFNSTSRAVLILLAR
jgi:hypothetical protein